MPSPGPTFDKIKEALIDEYDIVLKEPTTWELIKWYYQQARDRL